MDTGPSGSAFWGQEDVISTLQLPRTEHTVARINVVLNFPVKTIADFLCILADQSQRPESFLKEASCFF